MSKDGYNATERVSTEWEDALVKHKIIERKPKPPSQDVVDTQIMWDEKERQNHKYDDKTLDQLDELEDDIEENTLEKLRQKRLNEIKAQSLKDKYGHIQQISKPDYEKEVTKASETQAVICCLFVYGQSDSKIMLNCLDKLANKFKSIKFVKIIGNECIPDYPDNYCPTLVIYSNGDPVGNYKGLLPFGSKNGISADSIEWELSRKGILKTTLEENPLKFKMNRGKQAYLNANNGNYKNDSDDYDEEDEDSLDVD